jgi:hypothetical protein
MRRSKGPFSSFLVPGSLALCLLLLGYLCMPTFIRRDSRKTVHILNNLRQLDGAVQIWASEHGQTGTVAVTLVDIAPYLRHPPDLDGWVKPIAGERYTLKTTSERPEAQLTRQLDGHPEGTVIRLGSNGVEFILPNRLGGASGRQPLDSETNRTSAAAASRR